MHLREYISKIDNTPQYYLLYVPSNNHSPMPLVIEMPYLQKPERPFLESALAIGWPTSLDHLKGAADKAGVIVAVIDGRGNVGDAPIGEADALEAISDIVENYSIDVPRMYLFGTCEGGGRALLLAEHYPSVFAAVGVYGPKLDEGTEGSIWNWLGRSGKIRFYVDRLAHTPVNIVQGEFDDREPIGELQSFFKELKRISPSSELHIAPGGLHSFSEAETTLFPWLVRIRNELTSPPIVKATKEALAKVAPRRSAP
jgi:dienelactone hydrolase